MKLPLYSYALFLVGIFTFLLATPVFARVTPDDVYQEKMAAYQSALSKIQDPGKKELVETATTQLSSLNQTICSRFDVDIARMGAILEEEKRRKGITKTVVAYGQGNTPLDTAEYYVNYAEEAVAYQKEQDYTPNITSGNIKGGISTSMGSLNSDLGVLQNKILNAKSQVQKALDYYE